MTLRKRILSTTVSASLLFAMSTPAWAVSDTEFKRLQEQMAAFSGQLSDMQGKQSQLENENMRLKQQNAALQLKNKTARLNAPSSDLAPVIREKDSEAHKATNLEPTAGGGKTLGFTLPGTNTHVEVGGYAKADAIHDFNVSRDGSGEDFALYAAIPLEGSDEEIKGSNTRMVRGLGVTSSTLPRRDNPRGIMPQQAS